MTEIDQLRDSEGYLELYDEVIGAAFMSGVSDHMHCFDENSVEQMWFEFTDALYAAGVRANQKGERG